MLEVLRKTEVDSPRGRVRLLDAVDVITGVSGGSFTALAYGLYGDKLFDEYEKRFLKRDVQGELSTRFLSPSNWGALWSASWGRSEMAAQLYDDILFNGATFADLEARQRTADHGDGHRPLQRLALRLRAADVRRHLLGPDGRPAVARGRDVVGGADRAVAGHAEQLRRHLRVQVPGLAGRRRRSGQSGAARRRARRSAWRRCSRSRTARTGRTCTWSTAGSPTTSACARCWRRWRSSRRCACAAIKTPLDNVKRIVVVVVNSLSVPKNTWDQSERPPGTFEILIKATGVPIDRYSFETVELMRDMIARWDLVRRIRDSPAFDAAKDPSLAAILQGPTTRLYAIDVSFPQLKDQAEFAYLNDLPTSFVLPPEAVDRLRAAAATILLESPDFQQLLKDVGARVVPPTPKWPLAVGRSRTRRAAPWSAGSARCAGTCAPCRPKSAQLRRARPRSRESPRTSDSRRTSAAATSSTTRIATGTRSSSATPEDHRADRHPLRREEDRVDAVHLLGLRERALRGQRRATTSFSALAAALRRRRRR